MYTTPLAIRVPWPRLPITSERRFLRHALLHPTSLDAAVRYFQACTPTQALDLYSEITELARRYEDLPLPGRSDGFTYRLLCTALSDYLIWCFSHGWTTCPLEAT